MKNLIQPLVLSCLALLDLSSASAILTARAGPPRAFEVRDFSTLTNNLLAVVDSNATAPLTTRDVTSTYTDAINSNAPALNNLFAQSTVSGIAAEFRASLTCGAATLVFGNKIVINANSANYTVEEDEPWNKNAWAPASCFIKPTSPLEIAIAFGIITTLQSTYALRGAGHNANPGFSSVGQTGVVLHTEGLTSLSFSADKSTVTFGAGNTWDGVYGAAAKYNLTVAGGRAAGVGVGGLLLGGGMSHFSNYWGMACDNVINYEVVLADSTIVQANAKTNSDLFKALKGGGPNFGIVTSFTVKTFAGSALWYEVIVYNVADTSAVMTATVKVEAAMLLDNRIGLFVSDGQSGITVGMIYRGYAPPASAFQAFSAITPLVVAIPATIGTFQSCAIALASPEGLRIQIGAISIASDASLYVQMHNILAAFTNNTGITPGYTIQPFSAQGVAKGVANGGNSLGVASQSQAWLGYAVTWTDASLNDLAIAVTTQIIAASSNAATAKKELLAYEFMNDAGYLQDPLKSYGAASLSNMQAVSKKYDPKQVFQKLQNSGFLLSKA